MSKTSSSSLSRRRRRRCRRRCRNYRVRSAFPLVHYLMFVLLLFLRLQLRLNVRTRLPRAGGVSRRFRRTSVRSVSVSISRRRQRRIRSNRTRRHYRTPAFACPRRPANRPRRLRSFLSQHRNRLLQLLLVRGVKYFVLGKVRV